MRRTGGDLIMNEEEICFQVLLRSPEYPVIIIDGDYLWAAYNIEELSSACYFSVSSETSGRLSVVDSTGEEFFYYSEKTSLMPGIARKNWTKKKIIDLFN